MICFKCGNEDSFVSEKRDIFQIFKNKTYTINTSVTVCCDCKNYFIADGQLNNILRKVRSQYEKSKD
jgi:hypothetical protein